MCVDWAKNICKWGYDKLYIKWIETLETWHLKKSVDSQIENLLSELGGWTHLNVFGRALMSSDIVAG